MEKLIGITGGIAAGKSVVTRFLRDAGYTVICADEVSHELSQKGQAGSRAIQRIFGEGFFTPEGELDRKKLGTYVFSHPEELQRLNEAMHPLILNEIMHRAKNANGLVFTDAALLIETGLYRNVDEVWLVTADEEIRQNRLTARDGISMEEAKRRIASQLPDGEKIKYADAIIDNSGSIQNTIARVQELIKKEKGGKV